MHSKDKVVLEKGLDQKLGFLEAEKDGEIIWGRAGGKACRWEKVACD